MKKTERADKIASLIKEIEQRILDIYCYPKAIEENKIVFLVHSKLSTDFLKELVDEKWWFKWYDRTFYLINLRNKEYLDIVAIKNDFPEDEKEKFLSECIHLLSE